MFPEVFSNTSTTKEFLDDLGNSLPIRRAFRLWLSDHLSENSKEIEIFIQSAFTSTDVIQFWKDEILVSVYSQIIQKHSLNL